MNPFAALGLPASPALTDEDVRAAWRALATATHPDRPGGGNPAAYAAAAAAYQQLRTPWGRSEALADLASHQDQPAARLPPLSWRAAFRPATVLAARVRYGRPGRLAARAGIASAAGWATVLCVPGTASAPAVVTGCFLWWLISARADLAPPPGR